MKTQTPTLTGFTCTPTHTPAPCVSDQWSDTLRHVYWNINLFDWFGFLTVNEGFNKLRYDWGVWTPVTGEVYVNISPPGTETVSITWQTSASCWRRTLHLSTADINAGGEEEGNNIPPVKHPERWQQLDGSLIQPLELNSSWWHTVLPVVLHYLNVQSSPAKWETVS